MNEFFIGSDEFNALLNGGDFAPIEVELDSGTGSRVHTVPVTASHMRSGELARLTGVSADTLRHYERLGILSLSQRTNSGYRIFQASAVERVQLVQRTLQLGFSLKELSEIFRTRDDGGAPCHHVLHLTEEKLRSIGQQIQELQRTQDYMRKLVRDWRQKLKRTPSGSKAMLLHSLVARPRTKAPISRGEMGTFQQGSATRSFVRTAIDERHLELFL